LHRLVAPIALLTILLCASPASAAVLAPKQYGGQAKLGIATASRSDNGSCSVYPGLLSDLVLRCDSSSGSATAQYLFTLPKKAGSVSSQVNFLGWHRGIQVDTKRCSTTQFRVTVTQGSTGRADIASVMIEYYYPATKP